MNHTKEIRESVLRLYKARCERRSVDAKVRAIEERETTNILNYMFCNKTQDKNYIEVLVDEDSIDEYRGNKNKQLLLRATMSSSKKVNFLIDKLKEKLPKEIIKNVVRKQYIVSDMDGLIEYMKSLGADPKKFKKFIHVNESIDQDSIQKLYDFGEIGLIDLKGCYEVKESRKSITIRNMKY